MRIALVHDDLMQWGGAERLFWGIAGAFPDAPIYTSIFDSSHKVLQEKFAQRKIHTSFLQRIPSFRNLYKLLLPLYPLAFEQFDFSEFDIVISSSSRFAKSIMTKPQTFHICYCHTPPRFLWNFSGQQVPKVATPLLSLLRLYDQTSALRVNLWIANSLNVKKRIRKVYKQNAVILHPFIDINEFKDLDNEDQGYYLMIARLNDYKRVDLAVDVFNQLEKPLVIIGKGPQLPKLKKKSNKNIKFLNFVSEEKRLELLSHCKALIITADEDFGITAIEAQAIGKPVIAFGRGGALETVIDHKTGVLFKNQSAESLIQAIREFDTLKIKALDCWRNAQRFSRENFEKRLKQIVAKDFKAIQL